MKKKRPESSSSLLGGGITHVKIFLCNRENVALFSRFLNDVQNTVLWAKPTSQKGGGNHHLVDFSYLLFICFVIFKSSVGQLSLD